MQKFHRRLPVGAEVQPAGGVHFRVWAPKRKQVRVLVEDRGWIVPLAREPGADGYFSAFVREATPGSRYLFLLDRSDDGYPDPASRFQPEGAHGPSEVIDPATYRWNDGGWRGITLPGQVLYEMHFGTFTREGTYLAAIDKLPKLKEIGITTVEVMPLAEYRGAYGWGYDGVDHFAPTRNHGTPDELRRFVDAAHGLGLGVILDVVYNHFGPDGNYTGLFSDHYVSSKRMTDWGEGVNFDAEHSGPVREFVIGNAGYWIDEFHFDGLRLDAVHAIVDDSSEHILQALTRRAREAAGHRDIIVIAEDEQQRARFIRDVAEGGCGLDGAWNDDFHHACRVAATRQRDYYYRDYHGSPQELISAAKRGYLYQGQWNVRQKAFRGSATRGIPGDRFVTFLQNHDQIANSATGERLHQLTSPGRYRALAVLWLLSPGTPLFFQGQEWCASTPFHYFVDHPPELAERVREGRWNFLREFGGNRDGNPIDPVPRDTFEQCVLDWSERDEHRKALALHRDLLSLRRTDPIFAAQDAGLIEGAVITVDAFLLRFYGSDGDDRLLLVNLGSDFHWQHAAEPLIASPSGKEWRLLFSSDDRRYGGLGTAPLDLRNWHLPGEAAVVLTTQKEERADASGAAR